MTRKFIIPSWCEGKSEDSNYIRCCHCGNFGIYYQEGDGVRLHSLCYPCFKSIIKDLEVKSGDDANDGIPPKDKSLGILPTIL